jgi:hypothetical protein
VQRAWWWDFFSVIAWNGVLRLDFGFDTLRILWFPVKKKAACRFFLLPSAFALLSEKIYAWAWIGGTYKRTYTQTYTQS